MNIRVDFNKPIQDGTEVIFRSPVDCSQVTGLIVYYTGEAGDTASMEFAFADAHGNNVGDIDHLFAENVVVKVILDVSTGMAFVQNADTNAYIERTFVKTVNNIAPDEAGNVNTGGLLVVTKQDGDYMSHTSEEINDHIIKGGTAILRVEKYGVLVDLPVCYNREACVAFIYNDTESRTTEQYVIYDDGTWESFGGAELGVMDVTLVDGRATHTSQAIHDHASQGGMVRLLVGGDFLSLTHSAHSNASFVHFSIEDGSLTQYIIYEDGGCDQFVTQIN